MSILASAEKPKTRPIVATICGDAGTGKTRLAGSFPNAIFIRAEDGMQSIPTSERPDAFPLLTQYSNPAEAVGALFDQLIALANEDHNYKTVVIDSITALDAIFSAECLERDGRAKTLAQAMGGYGAGIQYVTTQHLRVRKACAILNERKGMNVLFLAHADIETMRLPDSDDYQRYSLRLNSKHQPPYVDDVDLVGFIRLVSLVKGSDGERKRAISTGERELVVASGAAQISKNRYGLTEAIQVEEGKNPLAGLVPIAGLKKSKEQETA